MYVVVDGVFYPADTPSLSIENRAFKYGDGLFESIRIKNRNACFLKDHIARLSEGMKVLRIEAPEEFSFEYFDQKIKELIDRNEISAGGRARITVSRKPGGNYAPISSGYTYSLEVTTLDGNEYGLNNEGFVIDLYTEIKKPVNKISNYKTSSALPYVMAAIYAREKKLHDVLLVNDSNSIIESTNSNVFIVCNGVLYTPGLADGCIAGVMRMQVINIALENKFKVYECSLMPQNLLIADEVFLTNAIKGLQWVVSYKQKRYFSKVTREILGLLNDKTA
ncbi:MAG: aminotransferase class IV [Flavobacteriales bacterium]